MKGIQIKINGQWIYLPEDFSISLEQTSPVFNEQGTFSFPFEIPLEPNRSVFKNIADPFGDISLRDIDKAPAEIWFAGVMLYRGIIEVDEEVELEDSIPVTFLSGNSDFMSRIEGMNCRDVPLDREIKLGYVITRIERTLTSTGEYISHGLPDNIMMNYTNYNISDQYPIKPYCNVRVCTQADSGGYVVLDAKRPFSGVCFYVLYFIDCLIKHLNMNLVENDLMDIEDMTRLAFFNTRCEHKLSEEETSKSWTYIKDEIHSFAGKDFHIDYNRHVKEASTMTRMNEEWFNYVLKDVFATKDNFPDTNVTDLINGMTSGFGVRFIYDQNSNSIRIILLKNVISQSEEVRLDAEILDMQAAMSKYSGINLTYGKSDDDSFDYDDYSNTKVLTDYNEIRRITLTDYDTTCYIDAKTGNAYRVKVNKDTGGEPALFEVGGFRDFNYGEGEKEETVINFSPVITNDLTSDLMDFFNIKGPIACFAGVELKKDQNFNDYLFNKNYTEGYATYYLHLQALCQENYDRETNETPPLRTYDTGFTLGIMRGPGNDSGLETVNTNYDGEGNSSWTQTVGSYAFTSDSCDNYGRFFDYNGTEAGGADQTGRFSLKLVAGKDGYPIDSQYEDRGLVSKFLSEYLYFMANKKTEVLTVRMNITQIIEIDFLKRYKIGDFVGFINKVSYTLDVNGVTGATIELYTL